MSTTHTAEEIKAFNGDHFLLDEAKALINNHEIDLVIETGSFKGHTTRVLSGLVKEVLSTEINEKYLNDAIAYCNGKPNITFHLGDSPVILDKILGEYTDRKILFFLDSHWQNKVPLRPELHAIAKAGMRPIILVHDFFVPGKSDMSDPAAKKPGNFGFDIYNGQPYTWEWIKADVDAIYGPEGYEMYYNEKVAPNSAKRGCLFLVPK